MQIFSKKNIIYFSFLMLFIFVLLLPFFVDAQVNTLVSDNLGLKEGNFANYFNNLFKLALVIGSVLAVLMIATAGLQYMTTDAVLGKGDSKERITQAVLGLLMLLSVWIFFKEINPNILNVNLDIGNSTFNVPKTNTSKPLKQISYPKTIKYNTGNKIGVWVTIPDPNKNCRSTKGEGWVGVIGKDYCPGVEPTKGDSFCCLKEFRYEKPKITGTLGKWCDSEGKNCVPTSKEAPANSFCYSIQSGGGYCFPTKAKCDEISNNINDGSISSSCLSKDNSIFIKPLEFTSGNVSPVNGKICGDLGQNYTPTSLRYQCGFTTINTCSGNAAKFESCKQY